MAIIDVVKYDGNDSEFVWKFPSDNLRFGSQLIVKQAQTAFFVKNGKVLDQFEAGVTTLKSGNIPLLTKLIGTPFGGNTPFQTEVWFINLISKLDNKWGTLTPIQLEDSRYGIIVAIRAFGQFGLKISNPRLFLESLVGTMKTYAAEKIVEYFKGVLINTITGVISKIIAVDNISVLQIPALIDQISKSCESIIKSEFAKFGIEIVNFYIMSINFPENDPSVIKLKEAKEKAMLLRTVGKDVYSFDRSMDVMQTAAGNEGNAGNIMGAGMGLGMGLGIGGAMGGQMGNLTQQMNPSLNQQTRNCQKCNSLISVASRYCGNCGADQNVQEQSLPNALICDKCGKSSPLGTKFCLNCGDEFILCPSCNTDNPAGIKFCINCGHLMENKCLSCGTELNKDAKFCGNCGKKLENK